MDPVTVDRPAGDSEQVVKPLCNLSFPISKNGNKKQLSLRSQVYGFSDVIHLEFTAQGLHTVSAHVLLFTGTVFIVVSESRRPTTTPSDSQDGHFTVGKLRLRAFQ